MDALLAHPGSGPLARCCPWLWKHCCHWQAPLERAERLSYVCRGHCSVGIVVKQPTEPRHGSGPPRMLSLMPAALPILRSRHAPFSPLHPPCTAPTAARTRLPALYHRSPTHRRCPACCARQKPPSRASSTASSCAASRRLVEQPPAPPASGTSTSTPGWQAPWARCLAAAARRGPWERGAWRSRWQQRLPRSTACRWTTHRWAYSVAAECVARWAGRSSGAERCPACIVVHCPGCAACLALQTHCALSGEQFEQFWDEEHQEWRYRDARALGAEEAARWGVQHGSGRQQHVLYVCMP